MERDNLVLGRRKLQCYVDLKPASWDALGVGPGEIPCPGDVHREAVLPLSSGLFQLLLPPLQSPAC